MTNMQAHAGAGNGFLAGEVLRRQVRGPVVDDRIIDGKRHIGHRVSIMPSESEQLLAKRRAERFANPIVPNLADRQAWELYDRVTVATNTATASSYIFFQTPISATKTKVDTNLIQAGRLEDPQRFFVTALRFIFSSDVKNVDIQTFLKRYYCEFWVGQKIYQEGPLVLFPGGAGVAGFTTKTDSANWNNGVPNPSAINLLGEEGIWILQGQQFRVETKAATVFTTSNASDATGLNILCVLDGILYRQVQ